MGDYSCDQPELSLRLGHGSPTDDSEPVGGRTSRVDEYNWYGNALQQQQQQQQQQQITVIYNGRTCVCDVTEIQARAIICMAKREMDERIERRQYQQQRQRGGKNHLSPLPALVPQLINPDLSMKRSLQRFLQKRKYRNIDASAPYSLAPETPSSSSSS